MLSSAAFPAPRSCRGVVSWPCPLTRHLHPYQNPTSANSGYFLWNVPLSRTCLGGHKVPDSVQKRPFRVPKGQSLCPSEGPSRPKWLIGLQSLYHLTASQEIWAEMRLSAPKAFFKPCLDRFNPKMPEYFAISWPPEGAQIVKID